jgi:hypothetical protein
MQQFISPKMLRFNNGSSPCNFSGKSRSETFEDY